MREIVRSVQPSEDALEKGRQMLANRMIEQPFLSRATSKSMESSQPALARRLSYRFAGIAAALFATLGGSSATLAHGALPGDLLYPVKIAGERIVASTKTSTEAQTSYQATVATRRLDEAKQLVEAEDGREAQATVALGLYNESVDKIAAAEPSDDSDDTRIMFTAHQATLADIESAAVATMRPEIEKSLRRTVAAEERLERGSKKPSRPMVEEKRRVAEKRLDHEERRLRTMNEKGEVSVNAETALGDASASMVEADVLLESGELDNAYAKVREALRLSISDNESSDKDDDDDSDESED